MAEPGRGARRDTNGTDVTPVSLCDTILAFVVRGLKPRLPSGTARGPPASLVRSWLIALLLSLAFSPPATACRYNIRELGFVDEGQPRFDLSVFVHGDEQTAWLPEFQSTARSILGRSNVVWTVIDEVQNPSAPELRFRAQLGPRLPGAMLHLPGRDDGWPLHLHATGDELSTRLKSLVASAGRAQLTAALIDTYGAVLVLRGTDEHRQRRSRRRRCPVRDQERSNSHSPTFPSASAWGRGSSKSIPRCRTNRSSPGRWAWTAETSPSRSWPSSTDAVVSPDRPCAAPRSPGGNLETQLSIIGADCECTMDHGWMTPAPIPISFSPADEARLPAALGFDPADAAVRAEVSQILAAQARIAADPNAPRASRLPRNPDRSRHHCPRNARCAYGTTFGLLYLQQAVGPVTLPRVAGFLLAILGICLIAWRKRK